MFTFNKVLNLLSILLVITCFSSVALSNELLSANVAQDLGISIDIIERFETVYEYEPTEADRNRPDQEYTRIITKVSHAHAGGDVHIWRVQFVEGYSVSGHLTRLYLDTDNDSATGRQDSSGTWQGVDEMVTLDNINNSWNESWLHYLPKGDRGYNSPPPKFVADGNVVYCRYEIPTKRDGEVFIFRARVVSQISGKVVNATPWLEIKAKAFDGKEVTDITYKEAGEVSMLAQLKKTHGLDLLRTLQTDSNNHTISALDFKLSGFKFYKAEYRAYSVIGYAGNMLTAEIKVSGTFFPGFVVYDDAGAQEYILKYNDQEIGSITTSEDNNRQWLVFSDKSIDVKPGDTISVQANGSGRHLVESVMLMKEMPPINEREFAIKNVNWINRDDIIIVGCTTTWPTDVEVEVSDPNIEVIRTTDTSVNHRFVLKNLELSKVYTVKLKSYDPSGKEIVASAEIQVPGISDKWGVRKREVPLVVDVPKEFGSYNGPWPVATGIPFPKGEVPNTQRMQVLDKNGNGIVAQFHPLARWPDGSVRWALIQFKVADVSKIGEYRLVYGSEVEPSAYLGMAVEDKSEGLEIVLNGFKVLVPKDGPLLAKIRGQKEYELLGVMSMGGREYSSRGERRVTIEELGPVRTVIRVEGPLRDDEGNELMNYEIRLYAYAGLPFIQISSALINTYNEQFALVDDWGIKLRTSDGKIDKVRLGIKDNTVEYASSELALTHVYEDYYKLTVNGESSYNKGVAQGWLSVDSDGDEIGIVVRNFAETYPKQLTVGKDGVGIGLAAPIESRWYVDPDFPEDRGERLKRRNTAGGWEYEKHTLHFYLQEGRHKLRQGMSLYDELLFVLPSNEGVKFDLSDLAKAFQRPLMARAHTEWYIGTQVLGALATVDQRVVPSYEERINAAIGEYLQERSAKRWYGSLNFGDWWGEREVNWGNNEYDLAYGMFIQYLRSGDMRAFYIAQDMATHYMNVDVQHYASNKFYEGVAWRHAIGHTGDYYSESPFEGKGYPRASVDLGHWVVEGIIMKYYLTGDTRALATAELVVNRYNREATRNTYDFSNGRVPGWHLIAAMALYGATLDPYHLNTANLIVERVLERQSPDGEWPRVLVPGHCYCDPPCIGSAGFMIGILLDGLVMYHHEVPSSEVEQAIINGARSLVNKMWDEEREQFKYTSCKKSTSYSGGDREAVIVYAAQLANDENLFSVAYKTLKNNIAKLSGAGKNLGGYMRRTPQFLGVLEGHDEIIEEEESPAPQKKSNVLSMMLLVFVVVGIGYLGRFLR